MASPLIIGLHAVKQAGKDTTFGFINEWALGNGMIAKRRGLADEMKLAIARLFFGDQPWLTMEWAIDWCDTLKENLDAQVVVPYWSPDKTELISGSVPMRDVMRFMGTEVGRRMWGEDFWLDKLLPLGNAVSDRVGQEPNWWSSFEVKPVLHGPKAFQNVADICVIPDVRFENEIRRIRDLGGITVKIRRKQAEDAVIAEAYARGKEIHVSDLLLHDEMFDYIVDNSDSIMQLSRERTYHLLDDHRGGRVRPGGPLLYR